MTGVMRRPSGSASAKVVDEREDATLVVEADTAEEALSLARQRLGVDLEVRSARRVERGGVAGFFAREVVLVEAAPPTPADDGTERTEDEPAVAHDDDPPGEARDHRPSPPLTGRPDIDALVRRLSGEDDDGTAGSSGPAGGPAERTIGNVLGRIDATEESFGTVLRRELTERGLRAAGTDVDGPVAAIELRAAPPARRVGPATAVRRPSAPAGGSTSAAAPAPASIRTPTPAPVAMSEPGPGARSGVAWTRRLGGTRREGPPGTNGVAWSVDRLAHLGLPFPLVAAVATLDEADDGRWVSTLAEALEPFVIAEPEGPAVFVGPAAHRIAPMLGVPVVEAPDPPPYAGSVCLRTPADAPGRAWLQRVRGDRVVHVVAGGRRWADLCAEAPDALVIADARVLISGLQRSKELGVPLSYVAADGGRLIRATPIDLALALRTRVGRR